MSAAPSTPSRWSGSGVVSRHNLIRAEISGHSVASVRTWTSDFNPNFSAVAPFLRRRSLRTGCRSVRRVGTGGGRVDARSAADVFGLRAREELIQVRQSLVAMMQLPETLLGDNRTRG